MTATLEAMKKRWSFEAEGPLRLRQQNKFEISNPKQIQNSKCQIQNKESKSLKMCSKKDSGQAGMTA